MIIWHVDKSIKDDHNKYLVFHVWWQSSTTTCQMIMLTCLICMSTCQIMISTCQIVLSTCHLFTFLKIQHENVSTPILAIQLTTVYMTSRHRDQTCRHNHFTCRHNFLLRRQVNINLWQNWLAAVFLFCVDTMPTLSYSYLMFTRTRLY